jgi:hypothetical protein
LYKIVGVHTKYKVVVYAFPENSRHATGGTSECSINYSDKNLNLERFDEWKLHKVPHLSGYIEEMAHNFVSATGAQFGWEMVGWSIGIKVAQKVAGNPTLTRQVEDTRRKQLKTFRRYMQQGRKFPENLPANQCDRIHAHILWMCEREYGPNFWTDFFTEIRKARPDFSKAASQSDIPDDERRNARYRITIDCFDRLKGLNFKKKLASNGISLTTDIKSFHPERPGWNRRFE